MQLSQSLLDKILRLANEAGKHLARFYQQDVKIQTKSDNTPVTEADLFVSQFLIEKLTALFPHAESMLVPQAKHEILFEKDNVRKAVLERVNQFLHS